MRRPGPGLLGLPTPGLILVLGICFLASLVGIVGAWAFWARASLVDVAEAQDPSWRFLDRKGQLLREVVNSRGERQNPLALGEMGLLPQAVITLEDRNFRNHMGVDLEGTLRALGQNIRASEVREGASTITMQLARLVWNHPRTWRGKAAQVLDALRLEAGLSKDQILESYLNLAPFLPGTQGAAAASRVLFSKSPQELNWSETALLAGLLRAPSALDPRKAPDKGEELRVGILDTFLKAGVLDQIQWEKAKGTQPLLMETLPPVIAGHFTDWIISKNGKPGEIRTTLEAPLQKALETLVTAHVESHRRAGVSNGALVVLDAATGEILAMVGSGGWDDKKDGAVNGAVARLQPGSTLKPFLYALGFEKGRTPATILADVETEYLGEARTLYIPQNYSQSFRGPVTIQEALSSSLNVPAIRLAGELGVPQILEYFHRMGLNSLDQTPEYYGLGLVLGNGEVTLLELAGAYGVLARGGDYLPPVFTPQAQKPEPVMAPEAAALVTAILSDDSLRLQNAGSALVFPQAIAVKTGTSSHWRDSWVMGYTGDIVLGCWVGNFDGSPTHQLSGASGAGPLFAGALDLLTQHRGGQPGPLAGTKDLRTQSVCAESGLAPGPHCPKTLSVRLLPGEPLGECTVHRQVELDIRTGLLAKTTTPARYRAKRTFAFLPPEYDQWLSTRQRAVAPRTYSPGEAGDGALVIQKPIMGDVYLIEPGYRRSTQTLPLRVLARDTREKVSWYLNGRLISQRSWPFTFDWPLEKGRYRLEARQGNNVSDGVYFEVK